MSKSCDLSYPDTHTTISKKHPVRFHFKKPTATREEEPGSEHTYTIIRFQNLGKLQESVLPRLCERGNSDIFSSHPLNFKGKFNPPFSNLALSMILTPAFPPG